MRLSRATPVILPVCALLIAAAWPVSAYVAHPAVLPVCLAAAAVAAMIARRPELGIGFVVAFTPLTNAAVAGMKPLHLALPAVTGGTLVYGLLVRRSRLTGLRPGVPFAVLLFAVVAAVTSVLALDPARSITRLFLVLTAALAFFAVLQVADRTDRLRVVIAGALVALLIAALHGIAQQVLGQYGTAGGVVIDGEIVKRVQGSFGHPNQYAGFLAILMPLAITVAVTRSLPGDLRLLAGAAALLAVQPLLFTFTRGAIVALVVGSILWLALRRPRMAVGAGLAIVVLAATLAPAALRERVFQSNTSGDLGLRADVWRAALEIYGQSPIVGAGLNNFGEAYANLPTTLTVGIQRRLLHQDQVLVPPHANNLALNVLAEQGLLGLVAVVLLIATGLAAAAGLSRAADPLHRALSVGLGAGLLVMVAHSLLELTLYGEVGLPLFVLLGAAVAAERLERAARSAGDPPEAPPRPAPSPIPRAAWPRIAPSPAPSPPVPVP